MTSQKPQWDWNFQQFLLLFLPAPPLSLPQALLFVSSSLGWLTVALLKTLLPLHNADAPSVGRMELLRHVSAARRVALD